MDRDQQNTHTFFASFACSTNLVKSFCVLNLSILLSIFSSCKDHLPSTTSIRGSSEQIRQPSITSFESWFIYHNFIAFLQIHHHPQRRHLRQGRLKKSATSLEQQSSKYIVLYHSVARVLSWPLSNCPVYPHNKRKAILLYTATDHHCTSIEIDG